MFDVRKPKQKNSTPIRAASKIELANYEKRKSTTILLKTALVKPITKTVKQTPQQVETKIESIRVNGDKLQVEPFSNEVRLDLGDLAFKSSISPTELSNDEYFFINCELDENILK